MDFKKSLLLRLTGLLIGVLLMGQGIATSQTTGRVLKRVPVSYSDPASGKQMFTDYCAVCHGRDGKGGGPAVEFLKTPPPDLTTMARRHNEKSVKLHVQTILRQGVEGNAEQEALSMPHWSAAFSRTHSVRGLAELRMHNLANYVESIQQH
jgi:mono/diheme cytochrome c family protein